MRVYLGFYAWHLFGAVGPGQHTDGPRHPERDLDADPFPLYGPSDDPPGGN